MTRLGDAALLRELEHTATQCLERHLCAARDWLPHEWLPWSRGRDFGGAAGRAWSAADSAMGEAAQAAFVLNLLTEDNLPSYHHELLSRLGRAGAWGAWVRRWTAEEARHASSLRDYLLLSRAVDPAALERDRMAAMQAGWSAEGKGLLRSFAYAAFQELATRVTHRNTGLASGDPVARRLLARISADEQLHMVFYRDLVAAALDLAPGQTLAAIARELQGFTMPGSGTTGFLRASVLMSRAGIYDVKVHRDEVVAPLLAHWQALTMAAGSPLARRAQAALAAHIGQLDAMVRRLDERRARRPGDHHEPGDANRRTAGS
jgi:acyl-[acyl-carrier-protein] desaturase